LFDGDGIDVHVADVHGIHGVHGRHCGGVWRGFVVVEEGVHLHLQL